MKTFTKKILAVLLTLCVFMSCMVSVSATGAVSDDYVILLDNSANTGFGQFYLHEVGMPYDNTYPIGDYTVRFDYYPLVNGSSKNMVAHLTVPTWDGNAFPGTEGQKWVEVTETLGEWQTISFDITTIAEGQFPWFYVGAGMKGYFDNYQIIDKSTGQIVLDFSPTLADVGKTSKDTATVVEFEEVHIHKAGAVVLENVVDTTCEEAGSYDEVVYCVECDEEISRNTVNDSVLLIDTTTVDNGTAKDFWFNTLGMQGYGALENGTYTIQFDVYPVTIPEGGNLFHFRTGNGSDPSSDAGFWKPELTAGEWTTTSNTFTVTDATSTGNHILYVYGGFKGCVDNIVILDANGNEVAGTRTGITGLTVPEQYSAYLTVADILPHIYGDVIPATDGDCCTNGTIAYRQCSACETMFDATTGEVITSIDSGVMGEHNWVAQDALHSECDEVADIPYDKCDICNKYRVGGEDIQDEAPTIAGHTLGEVVPATEGGDCCTNGTIAYRQCSACETMFDATTGEVITSIDSGVKGEHNWVAQDALESVCEAVYDIEYEKCDVCGKYRVGGEDGEIIDQLPEIDGHDYEVRYAESVCSEVYDICYYECLGCGKLFDDEGTEIDEAPEAPGHTYSFIKYDETHHWYECACGEYEDKYEHEGDPCGCGYTAAPTGGWKLDGTGWWYQYADGSYPASAWLELGGTWYYFNASGYMVTGWQSIGGTWYYFNASGAMATGWVLDGAWYYMDASGAMVTGWKQVGDTWYYFNASGAMATGWVYDGAWYYMNASGAMATGWVYDGAWYYMNASGAMVTGWQVIGGSWYYFYDSGAMAANCYVGSYWVDANGVWVA